MYTDIYLNEIFLGADKIKQFLDMLSNKNILITGASGVIGTELSDILLACNQKYNSNIGLYLVGRSTQKLKEKFCYFDDKKLHFLNYEELNTLQNEINYIVHLASVTSSKMFIEQPCNVLQESYELTKNIFDFATQKKVDKIVYVSSVEVYGRPYENQHLLAENMHGELLTTSVRNSYPEAKRFCESLASAYASQFGLNVVIARPAKVFSSVINPTDKRVFVDFASKTVNKQNIILKSDGKQIFTYCYGLDVCIGLLLVMLKGQVCEAYNIGSDNCVATIFDIATIFAKLGGVNVEFQIEDNAKTGYVNVGHCIVDNTKLKSLGFESVFDLQNGIENILQQYKSLTK